MNALSYQDVYLIPKHGILRHRSDADLYVSFLGRNFRAPWVPSNMSDVVNPGICKWLSSDGYPYFMHRFGDTYEFVKLANKERWRLISISVGENKADRELLGRIAREQLRVDWITIDIAHGDSVMMEDMIKYVKSLRFRSHDGLYAEWFASEPVNLYPKIIAGNVATLEAVERIRSYGADAVKVGIAGGKSCSTKTQTGFHFPMFSCVIGCSMRPSIPIIADGGIRDTGDFAKALVAGATLVMAGSVFAACIDAPGENIYAGPISTDPAVSVPAILAKRYHGSASEHQKGHKRYVEGFCNDLPCNGMTYAEKYQELTDGLSSAVSYGGGTDLSCFKSVNWVEVSR